MDMFSTNAISGNTTIPKPNLEAISKYPISVRPSSPVTVNVGKSKRGRPDGMRPEKRKKKNPQQKYK